MIGQPRMDDRYAAHVRNDLMEFIDASAEPRTAAPSSRVARRPRRDVIRDAVAVAGVLAVVIPVTLLAIGHSPGSPAAPSAGTNVSTDGTYLTTRTESLTNKLVPASAAGQGVLGVAANGCITVGGFFLVAPFGSTISADGMTLNLVGIGSYKVGEKLPALGGVTSETLKRKDLPSNYDHCGEGRYQSIWGNPPR